MASPSQGSQPVIIQDGAVSCFFTFLSLNKPYPRPKCKIFVNYINLGTKVYECSANNTLKVTFYSR